MAEKGKARKTQQQKVKPISQWTQKEYAEALQNTQQDRADENY